MYWAYHALGVRPGVSQKEARASYLKLLKAYHPDKLDQRCLSAMVRQRELRKFYEIQAAWEALSAIYLKRSEAKCDVAA